MKRAAALACLAVDLAAADAAPAPRGPAAALWAKLEGRVRRVDERLDGVLGVAIRDLASGASVALRPDLVFPQASSIKLAVLYELYRQADEARVDLSELTRPGLPRVGGGGVLQELGPGVSLSWRDLAVLMMGHSDNEATNLLIERVGLQAVNLRLESLGLSSTRLRRRMMDLEAARRGEENLGTPAEMAQLAEHVYRGTGLSPERSRDLAALAATAKLSVGSASIPFRAPLPESLKVLDKAGELEGVRCVTAAVDLPGRPYVAAIMTSYLRRAEDGEQAIRAISEAAYQTFDRLARSSEHGRAMR